MGNEALIAFCKVALLGILADLRGVMILGLGMGSEGNRVDERLRGSGLGLVLLKVGDWLLLCVVLMGDSDLKGISGGWSSPSSSSLFSVTLIVGIDRVMVV